MLCKVCGGEIRGTHTEVCDGPQVAKDNDEVEVTTDGWALPKGTRFHVRRSTQDDVWEPRLSYSIPHGCYKIVERACSCGSCDEISDATVRAVRNALESSPLNADPLNIKRLGDLLEEKWGKDGWPAEAFDAIVSKLDVVERMYTDLRAEMEAAKASHHIISNSQHEMLAKARKAFEWWFNRSEPIVPAGPVDRETFKKECQRKFGAILAEIGGD